MESYGADVVLVTDSAGALLPPTVRKECALYAMPFRSV
jgi:hypothetical protein